MGLRLRTGPRTVPLRTGPLRTGPLRSGRLRSGPLHCCFAALTCPTSSVCFCSAPSVCWCASSAITTAAQENSHHFCERSALQRLADTHSATADVNSATADAPNWSLGLSVFRVPSWVSHAFDHLRDEARKLHSEPPHRESRARAIVA